MYMNGHLVEYPLQNNLSKLPNDLRLACTLDLVRAKLEPKSEGSDLGDREGPRNLDEYLSSQFGEALSNIFFRPYIYKVLTCPTIKLSHDWAKERIPSCDLVQEMKQILQQVDDPSQGDLLT